MSKAKKTRRYIIERTADIFNKKGFVGTSLTDLTKATGLTKGSIYGNFKNKKEVAEAAFNFNYQGLIKHFTPNLASATTAKAKLHAFLDTYEQVYEWLIEHGGCPILNNAVDADDTNKAMAALSIRAFHDWELKLVNMIKQGKKERDFSEDIDPQYYADLFIANIEGSLMLSKITGEKRYFKNAIQHLRDIVDNIL